jgi:hypothetical protein
MGFFDKLKGAASFVTGGAAKVTIEWQPQVGYPGQPIQVRITAQSTGGAINSGGVFVDVEANEQLNIPQNALGNNNPTINYARKTFSQTYPIAPAFQLAPNETKMWEGHFVLPPQAQPTYDGPLADHDWGMRARIEMTGNDPDSGFLKFIVGKQG